MQVPRLTKIVVNMASARESRTRRPLTAPWTIWRRSPVSSRACGRLASRCRTSSCVPVTRWRGCHTASAPHVGIHGPAPDLRDAEDQGLPWNPKRGFDGRGNFSLGLKEQLIFPEIDFDAVEQVRGMNICVVTTAKTDEESVRVAEWTGHAVHQGRLTVVGRVSSARSLSAPRRG